MRIVAGRFGGRRLVAPPGTDTRPTGDRVRESLFSILGPLHGLRVLDLFAGTGALGLEALSRGAAHATFVERDRRALTALRANVSAFGLAPGEATVVAGDYRRYVRDAARRVDAYDLVLLDPPYHDAPRLKPELDEVLRPLLGEGARVVTESDRRSPLILDLGDVDERRYGDTLIAIHRP
jgi:16S rRNA (guanine966-N2)-methyltransferase